MHWASSFPFLCELIRYIVKLLLSVNITLFYKTLLGYSRKVVHPPHRGMKNYSDNFLEFQKLIGKYGIEEPYFRRKITWNSKRKYGNKALRNSIPKQINWNSNNNREIGHRGTTCFKMCLEFREKYENKTWRNN